MTRQAFILSDCEFSECGEKPYALLTANPTKEHHYIAQTEQRQHAHNPQVSPQNQNVYKLPLSMFREPAAALPRDYPVYRRHGLRRNQNL